MSCSNFVVIATLPKQRFFHFITLTANYQDGKEDEHTKYNPQIKMLRESHGMTMRELAARLNVSSPAIVYWENGSNYPSLPNLLAMADLFGCSLDAICGRDEPGQTSA